MKLKFRTFKKPYPKLRFLIELDLYLEDEENRIFCLRFGICGFHYCNKRWEKYPPEIGLHNRHFLLGLGFTEFEKI